MNDDDCHDRFGEDSSNEQDASLGRHSRDKSSSTSGTSNSSSIEMLSTEHVNGAEQISAANKNDEMVCHIIHHQIMNKLMACTKSYKALELSKLLGIPKAIINHALYSLKRRGKIKCTTETPPLWAYDRESGDALDSEKCVINLLTLKASPMSSHSIAWELNEPKAVTNRILYDLERIGKVERLQISPPIWIIKSQILRGEGQQRNELDTRADGRSGNKRKRVEDESIARNESISLIPDVMGQEKRNFDSKEGNCSSRQEAASVLLKDNQNMHSCSQKGDVDPELSQQIANAVWEKYNTLHPTTGGKVILAGYALRTSAGAEDEALEVIALGTGTKALPGNKYCLTGSVVHDCHAEIIARRSLLRWLYKQLVTANEPHSYAIRNGEEGMPFKLRPFELWLYISQAPCGDAAVFSLQDPVPVTVPSFTTRNHGMFRTKNEAYQGGVIVKDGDLAVQSFDGLQLGNRSKCLTCSDKLAKRCLVGVQGALLSQLMKPLYMNGIVIGDVFSHSHVARALCCRSEKALGTSICGGLSSTYALHHPKVGHCPIKITRCEQIGRNHCKTSINWATGDEDVEIVDPTTGMTGMLNNKDTARISRISKKVIFRTFLRLRKPSSRLTYKESKAESTEYQQLKEAWVDAMKKRFKTNWLRKPSEVEDFYNL